MDLGLLIQLVSGAAGGHAAGAFLKGQTLGVLGNALAGAVGGGLGGQILTALLGAGAIGTGDLNLSAIITQIAGGGVGGAVLTLIVTYLNRAYGK
ncbi:MAG: hypothetical protein J0I75_16935 [Hyphomicrobium sp.]|nr:hypothetical protein [Hyphomicrobium sp.]ODT21013.1 MAG: hypothetical protein ABS54_13400 [Hyphomicrobium sp. SCN 65-11]